MSKLQPPFSEKTVARVLIILLAIISLVAGYYFTVYQQELQKKALLINSVNNASGTMETVEQTN